MTANDVITDALGEIGYLAAETPIEPADATLAFNILNDMLAEWDESRLLPGVGPVVNLATEIRASRGKHAAIRMNLAGRLSGPFRRPLTQELVASIRTSTEALLRVTVKIGKAKLPDTLPKGSGNECWDEDTRFFEQNNETNF